MTKYGTLVKILDELRNEAPTAYKRYHPEESNTVELDKARSRAFIHLFLKGRFGLYEFNERENFITDDEYDGGIDAYYIDQNSKTVYFIQSKFRTTEKNFESKEIEFEELLAMDVDRITDGEDADEAGNKYNSKIQNMQSRISSIEDVGRYSYKVIILANLSDVKPSSLRKLVGGFPAEVYDFEKCYRELVFPIVSGCFFKAEEIRINLSLVNKEGNEGRISYTVNTELSDCKIMVVFVPLIEIGKMLFKYKNSVLKYNPRCFLGLNNNVVNPKIAETVTSRKTNEFALFNNGITILSDETQINSQIALKDKAQLIINNPQIINGGQTAFTLATLYEKCSTSKDFDIFNEKDVLVKVVTFIDRDVQEGETEEEKIQKKLKLIEDMSRATNEQSLVSGVDRRSNDKVIVNYQSKIYDEFGYFLNRKQGEFREGLEKKYIDRDLIIDLNQFMRIALSVNGDATRARRNSDEVLFRDTIFNTVFKDTEIYKAYIYGFMCYQELLNEEKKYDKIKENKYGLNSYGNALRYGKYAVVCMCAKNYKDTLKTGEYRASAKESVSQVLSKWKSFEDAIRKELYNNDYFYSYTENGSTNVVNNYDGYYKGRTLNGDLEKFSSLFQKS